MIGRNLKMIRDRWRMQQEEMANIFDCTRVVYSNYELEKTPVPTNVLLLLEKMTGIRMRRLLEEELLSSMIYKEPLDYENVIEGESDESNEVNEHEPLYGVDFEKDSLLDRVRRIERVLFGKELG